MWLVVESGRSVNQIPQVVQIWLTCPCLQGWLGVSPLSVDEVFPRAPTLLTLLTFWLDYHRIQGFSLYLSLETDHCPNINPPYIKVRSVWLRYRPSLGNLFSDFPFFPCLHCLIILHIPHKKAPPYHWFINNLTTKLPEGKAGHAHSICLSFFCGSHSFCLSCLSFTHPFYSICDFSLELN